MPRAGLSRDRVVEIALELAAGDEPVTLGKVAARAGVRTPSLYKHVESGAELDSLVAERILIQFAADLDTAIGDLTGRDAARATLDGYRDFARSRPGLYGHLPVQPNNDPRLRPHSVTMMRRIARALGYDDSLDQDAIDALRLLRSASEGFIQLERAGGFGEPADVDASWRHLVDVISAAAVPDRQEHTE